jgi:lysylphosphatidylglycerol synthetase-like protein (DUF2156 family)
VKISGVHHQPDGPAFDLVLILHVGCVVVGLVTLVASISTATRLRTVLHQGAPFPDALARYFRPGVNWAGRSIYGIPLFGFFLLALSHGAYALHDGWVMSGLVILVAVVLIAEGSLWPAERMLQISLAPLVGGDAQAEGPVLHDAKVMATSALVALVLLVLGSALMVVQP